MHWIFIILGYQFQQIGFNHISNIPEQLAQRCIAGYRTGEFIPVDFEQLMHRCLAYPFDSEFSTEKLDPVTLYVDFLMFFLLKFFYFRLTWYIFSWSVIEHNAFETLGVNSALISPELTRSSLWLLTHLIEALSTSNLDTTNQDDFFSSEDTTLLLRIPTISSNVLQKLIEFILSKVFAILTKLSGETKYF